MRFRFVALTLFLLVCVSAFPQNGGTILCDPTMTSVPAWIAPGMPYVVRQLPCGQIVSVLGMGSFSGGIGYSSRPPEYAKIQLDDREAYVDARYIALTETQPRPAEQQGKETPPQKQGDKSDEEQKKWGIVTKDQIKVHDEALRKPAYLHGPRTFLASVSNNSELPVSQILLLVRLFDCNGKANSDFSNCEIIGEAKPVIETSIPPGQTRRVTGSPLFDATPRVRGTFSWGYKVLGVKVE
jgi:hypothetical protein